MALSGPVSRLLETLNPLQRSAWGIILGGAASGLSGNSILGALRGSGIGFRTETFFSVFNEARLQVGTGEYLSSLESGRVFNPQRLPRAPYNITSKYGIVVGGDSLNVNTGEIESLTLTIGLDDPVSVEEIRQLWEDLAAQYGFTAPEMVFERAYRRA
jgi:hypothetical protein